MKTKPTPIASAVTLALMGMMLSAQAQAQQAAAPAAAASAAATDVQRVEVVGIRASREAALTRKRASETLVEVITAEDIRRSGARSVPDLLRMVPGVNVARTF